MKRYRSLLVGIVAVAAVWALLIRPHSPPTPAGASSMRPCAIEVESLAAAASRISQAHSGGVVCLAPGRYTGSLVLAASHARYVKLEARGATVGAIDFASSAAHINVDGISSTAAATIGPGASFIKLSNSRLPGVVVQAGSHNLTISHDLLHGGDYGVVLNSENCAVSFGPVGCSTAGVLPAISNVVIEGNKFQGPFNDDAIHVNNYRNLIITGNEITGDVENGNHNDVMQSTWGGRGLTFTDNYVHDICGQGFFIKDGLVSNVVFDNNLFARWLTCPHAPQGELAFDVYDVHGMQMTHNTFVNGAEMLQAYSPSAPESTGIVMQDNVLDDFLVENPDPGAWHNPAVLREAHNLISGGWDWLGLGLQATSDVHGAPRFVHPARNAYELAAPLSIGGQRFHVGIDGATASQQFGPRRPDPHRRRRALSPA
jgi:Right handed beta helix region